MSVFSNKDDDEEIHSVGGGEERLHLDTAGTLGVIHGELDVALVTPGGVPGVLDEPVVETGGGIGAISDGEDGVIEVGSAGGVREDTGRVELEDQFVGLDGDGKWLLGESGLHLGLAVGGDVIVGGDIDGSGRSFAEEAAGGVVTGTGGVWVDRLELSGVGLVVVEGAVLETTVAAEVQVSAADIGAVNELLLREGKEITSGNEVSTLQSTSGGEGPA